MTDTVKAWAIWQKGAGVIYPTVAATRREAIEQMTPSKQEWDRLQNDGFYRAVRVEIRRISE